MITRYHCRVWPKARVGFRTICYLADLAVFSSQQIHREANRKIPYLVGGVSIQELIAREESPSQGIYCGYANDICNVAGKTIISQSGT